MNENKKIILSLVILLALLTAGSLYIRGYRVILLRPFGYAHIPLPPPVPTESNTVPSENTQEMAPTPVVPQDPRSEIIYDTNGKLDTSKWVEYRSEYGGFSVVAPKIWARIGCAGRGGCGAEGEEPFSYSLTNGFEEDLGFFGMRINIIKKANEITFENVAGTYIVGLPPYAKVINKKMTTTNGYPTLQFDIIAQSSTETFSIASFYSPVLSGRVHILDLGTRFAVVINTLAFNRTDVENYNKYNPDGSAEPLDDNTLADIYQAILDSFKAFPPTK